MEPFVISEKVKEKLEQAVELWAEDVLPGKPAILGCAMFASLETIMVKTTEEILNKF